MSVSSENPNEMDQQGSTNEMNQQGNPNEKEQQDFDQYEAELAITANLTNFYTGTITPGMDYPLDDLPELPEIDEPFPTEDELVASIEELLPEETLRRLEEYEVHERIRNNCRDLCHTCMDAMSALNFETVRKMLDGPTFPTQCMICHVVIRTNLPHGFLSVNGEPHPCFWIMGAAHSRKVGLGLRRVTSDGIEESLFTL